MNILTVNLLFSTFVFWIAARIYVFPKLDKLNHGPSCRRFFCCIQCGVSD